MRITDDKILRISLITALIGIIGLIAFTPSLETKSVSIDEINRGMIDEEVAISGVCEDIKKSSSGTTYFLTINDGTGQISAIAFESTVSQMEDSTVGIEMFKGKHVKATGTITEYNSDLELILENENSLTIE